MRSAVFFILWMVVLWPVASKSAALPPPLVVRVEGSGVRLRDGGQRILIALGNQSTKPLKDIGVFAETQGGRSSAVSVPLLAPGAWQVCQVTLAQDLAGVPGVVVAQYTAELGPGAVAAAFSTADTGLFGTTSQVQTLLMGSVVGGFISLAGIGLTSWFTGRRERRQAQFQWSKFLFERYDREYREFLSRVESTREPAIMWDCFLTLDQNALIPPVTREWIKRELTELRNAASEDQVGRRDGVVRKLREILADPIS